MLDTLESYTANTPFLKYNHINAVKSERDHCTFCIEIGPDHMNQRGMVHGGVFLSIADAAAGMAARSDGRDYVTSNLNLNFIRGLSGGTLTCTADVIRRGKTITLVHVVLMDADGNMAADGTVTMFCVGDSYNR